jgi:hypothetical protein
MSERFTEKAFLVEYSDGQSETRATVRAVSADEIQILYPCLEIIEGGAEIEGLHEARLGNPYDLFLSQLPCQPEYEEYESLTITKANRHNNQLADSSREPHHPFKRVQHTPDSNGLQRRTHLRERQAVKKR